MYVYSLAELKSKDGGKDTTNIIEEYKKGYLGAIPEPDLIKSLIP